MDEENDNVEMMFGGSIDQFRDQALMMFNFCLASNANMPIPPVTDTHRKYLTVQEVEAIVAEKAEDFGGGYALGATSRAELLEKMHELMGALVMRIRSNILHEGVKQGYLDAVFDPETNDFDFEITEKGKAFNGDQFREFWGGFEPGAGTGNNSDSKAENN